MKIYELSFQKNIRDLGGLKGHNGKTIKYNRIFRGGALHTVNKDDIEVIKSFHLTDMIDFRGEKEFIHKGDVKIEGINYINLPTIEEKIKQEDIHNEDGNLLWFVNENDSGFEHIKKQYKDFVVSKKTQEAYRRFFEILMQDNKVIYFHCSQGKDRAGLAAFYIEIALGVSMLDAMNDYLLSNIAMDKKIDGLIKSVQNKPFYNERYHQSLLDVFAAKKEYLQASIDTINENYGSVLNYLQTVLNVNLDRMRELYLE